MSIITLNVRPEQESYKVDEDIDFILMALEAQNRFLRVHSQGKKLIFQKSLIIKVEPEEEDSDL